MSSNTPVTPEGLKKYDDLDPVTAIQLAWLEPGPRPQSHFECKDELRRSMPLLARALDRLNAGDRTDKLMELSKLIERHAKTLERAATGGMGHAGGTLEQWHAIIALKDAARFIHGAAGWLARHEAKHG